ncbi:MAG: TolC family protein [Nitrososphaera sp.]|nr:TolC family protein [Nitrososphaera sp.]MCI0705853.1 TolC family protein [Ignavibacteriota bacterium]
MLRIFVDVRNWSIAIVVLLVLVSSGSFAQQEKRTLTLDDAIKIALEKNQDLTSARLEVEKANAQVNEAIGTALPSLNLTANYTRALKKPVFFLPDFEDLNSGRTIAVEIGSDHSIDMTLSAQQILFNSAVFTGVGAASIYQDAAKEMYRARQLETITKVRRAFYGMLLANEVAEMMRENLKNAEDNLKNVQIMKNQGIVSEYDELRATVGVENLRPAVIQAENNYLLSIDGLRATMGVAPTEEYNVQGSLSYSPVDGEIVKQAMETVLQNNPSLGALRHQVDVNRALVSIQRSNYLPTLAAFGNYQYQTAQNDLRISTRDFIGSSLVGLRFSINLFEGLQTNAKVDQAKVEVRKSEEQLNSVENNMKTAVHSVVLQLEQSQKRIAAQERTVEQAERGYKIATTRFTSGSGTQLEVNDAQLALTQAKVNRMQAIYDYVMASAELDQLLGRLPSYAESSLN